MKLIKGYYFKVVMAIFTKGLEAVFELLMPLMMAKLIDKGIAFRDYEVIKQMALALLVLTILGYASSVICQKLSAEVAFRSGYRLRKELFETIQNFRESEYDMSDASGLINRVTVDVNNVQDMINRVLRLGVRAPILIIGSVVAMLSIHHSLAMRLLVSLPIFVTVIITIMYFTIKGQKSIANRLDILVKKTAESLRGIRIIQAFGKQEDDLSNFDNYNNDLRKQQLNLGVISSLSGPFTTLIMNGVLLLLVWMSASNINVGAMTQGQVIAVINYATQLVLTLIIFMNIVMIASKGLVSYKRIDNILKTPINNPWRNTTPLTHPVSLKMENVSFHYPGEKRKVIKNITLEIPARKTVAIVGLTGSGKSTLARLIAGLIEPTEGKILLNGQPYFDHIQKEIRKNVGYASQSAQFLKGSLQDNVLMGNDGNVEEALIDAQAKEMLLKGLEHEIEESGKNLSGGQKQRINIARQLVKKPRLLILDDSLSALDTLTDRNLRHVLNTKYTDVTKIIISQRTKTVQDADLIVVLDKGEIIAQGKHAELLEGCSFYKKIDSIQNMEGKNYGNKK